MFPSVFPRFIRILTALWRWLAFPIFLACLESIYHNRSIHTNLIVPLDEPFGLGCQDFANFPTQRANATLLMLARNTDLEGAKSAISSVERRFNRRANYPLLVLNDQNFTKEFEAAIKSVSSGHVSFAIIPKHMWGYPSNVDQKIAEQAMKKQEADGILYGASLSYHHMCRFNSGFFFDVGPLTNYRWYWRIEPEVEFTCDITYDPFVEMQRRGKKYGYVIALWELYKTAPTLFRKVSDYKKSHRIRTSRLWTKLVDRSRLFWPIRSFLSVFSNRDLGGDEWNLCHFWSNFEIADMDWFRSKEYRDFFDYLDRDGGFYYERVCLIFAVPSNTNVFSGVMLQSIHSQQHCCCKIMNCIIFKTGATSIHHFNIYPQCPRIKSSQLP